MQAYYFGVSPGRSAGHYCHNRDLSTTFDRPRSGFPILPTILDGGLLPTCAERKQGLCELWKNGKWTILSFWDQSGDRRPGSNSTFLLEGDYTFEQAVQHSRQIFPSIFTRIDNCKIVLVHNI